METSPSSVGREFNLDLKIPEEVPDFPFTGCVTLGESSNFFELHLIICKIKAIKFTPCSSYEDYIRYLLKIPYPVDCYPVCN